MKLALFDVNTPVDESHTHTRWIIARSFFRSPLACIFMRADADSKRRTLKVFEQDKAVVERIKPILAPAFKDEVSVKSDALQIAFRKRIQDYEQRGWAIDSTRAAEFQDGEQRALSLPSPGRQAGSERDWVIGLVPLTEPRASHQPAQEEEQAS